MHRFECKIRAGLQNLLPDQPVRIGVACSGGPDSVALLHALARLAPSRGWWLTVLHVNHGLRAESEQEQALVANLCRTRHLLLRVRRLRPLDHSAGVEAWGRDARYAFFARSRQACPLDYVATAHTQDDQAETVLFQLLRGSARRGLAGIPRRREGWLIRPLLDFSRHEIETYIQEREIAYVVDPSNTDLRYTRNKIRHHLLPLLESEYSPQIRRHLASLAETAREEEDWLDELAAAARRRLTATDNSLDSAGLTREPIALRTRILRQWVEQTARDLKTIHLRRLRDLSEGRSRGRLELPGKVSVVRERGRLRSSTSAVRPPTRDYCYPLCAGQSRVVGGGWNFSMSMPLVWQDGPRTAQTLDAWAAVFDCEVARCGLVVRNYRRGDRIRPLGMHGRKKVHDVFVDAKLSRPLRQGFPVVEIDGELAWVPGCVRSGIAAVTSITRRVYQVQVNPPP